MDWYTCFRREGREQTLTPKEHTMYNNVKLMGDRIVGMDSDKDGFFPVTIGTLVKGVVVWRWETDPRLTGEVKARILKAVGL